MDNNGYYNIDLDCNAGKTITLAIPGYDTICTQTLDIDKICSYLLKKRSAQIINDLDHFTNFACIRQEEMMEEIYMHFLGKWQNAYFELYIFHNKSFSLMYTDTNGRYMKEGYCIVLDANNIKLNTVYIENLDTNTYTDSDEVLDFEKREGRLISEDYNIDLTKN